jgi:hypothetical protein
MAFAFNPDDGPARLFRYVAPGTLPAANLLAIYDKTKNLLIIDREHFERLSDVERHRVLRTQRSYLEVIYEKNRPPAIAA